MAFEETQLEANKSQKRPRRQFTDEFKAGAVQQVLGEGRSSADVARSLDLRRSALDQWVKQALVDSGKGAAGALTTSEREELAQLGSENPRLKMERDMLKKRRAFSRKRTPDDQGVKFAGIDAEKATWPVTLMSVVFSVSTSGYYAWKAVQRGTQVEELDLRARICAIHKKSRGVYGSPMIHVELRNMGIRIGLRRRIQIMQEQGLAGRSRLRKVRTTDSRHTHPVAPNLLEKDFNATEPNKKWVGCGVRKVWRVSSGKSVVSESMHDPPLSVKA